MLTPHPSRVSRIIEWPPFNNVGVHFLCYLTTDMNTICGFSPLIPIFQNTSTKQKRKKLVNAFPSFAGSLSFAPICASSKRVNPNFWVSVRLSNMRRTSECLRQCVPTTGPRTINAKIHNFFRWNLFGVKTCNCWPYVVAICWKKLSQKGPPSNSMVRRKISVIYGLRIEKVWETLVNVKIKC